MTNLECAIAVLMSHREARGWTDEAVALDLLGQLGVEAAGEAVHATPVVDPSLVTEAEVVAAEATAQEAVDKATSARAALIAQTAAGARRADVAADEANVGKGADYPEAAADQAKAANSPEVAAKARTTGRTARS